MRQVRRATLQKGVSACWGAYRGLPIGGALGRRTAGFSMVELLITLVLLGIVTAIAVPYFRGWVDNSNLKGATRIVSSDFYETRARAMSENRMYTITYHPDPINTYTITAPAVATPVVLSAVNETKNFSEFGSVRMISANGGTAGVAMTIQSRGTVSEAGTLVVTNARNSIGTITLLMTGRAHVSYSMQ